MPEAEQVVRCVEDQAVGVIEPPAGQHLVADRPERGISQRGEVEGGRHAHLLEA